MRALYSLTNATLNVAWQQAVISNSFFRIGWDIFRPFKIHVWRLVLYLYKFAIHTKEELFLTISLCHAAML